MILNDIVKNGWEIFTVIVRKGLVVRVLGFQVSSKFYLPSKIIIYLKRVVSEYQTTGNDLAARVISSSAIFVAEETSFDNWNGGITGYDVILFLPPDIFGEVTLARKSEFEADLLDKLRLCSQSVDYEFFNAVNFEDEDQNDPNFQSAITINDRPQMNPDTLSIWRPNQVRLFISHRDIHKTAAKSLANDLEEYGICSFVAHDTIEPMTTWQHEIIKGLQTMEIMLVYLTDDFHDSVWTNQEVGFALGRNIPVISLKLGMTDPRGFIGAKQALKCNSNNQSKVVTEIYNLIAMRLGNEDRLRKALISAFATSPDFNETKTRFDRLKNTVEKLDEDDITTLIKAFESNSQLYNSTYLTSRYNRFINFLNQASNSTYLLSGRTVIKHTNETDIPF